MDIMTQTKVLKLVTEILDSKKKSNPIIPFFPQKAAFPTNASQECPFERVAPELQGIRSSRIEAFLKDIQNDDTLNMHDIIITRNGKVISEGYFGSHKKGVWHITYSLCKSITSFAIGMLIDDGKISLDDRILDVLHFRTGISKFMRNGYTIENALTMSTGVTFNEAGAVTEEDWLRCYFESLPKFETGSDFDYNSMNTYILSCIVKEVSGLGLNDFLEDRLWKPLGISLHHWELSPAGIEKGGWGLYIRPEDILKIGQMVLNGGIWNGTRIISEEYLKNATTKKMTAPAYLGDFNYGYHIWVGREQNSFLFNGMFGQNLIGFKDTGILIVSNAGNDENFQQSNYFKYLKKYFGSEYFPEENLTVNQSELKSLRLTEGSLYANQREYKCPFYKKPLIRKQITNLIGKKWRFNADITGGIGLLPLYSQVLQNNYTHGLQHILFSADATSTDAMKIYLDFFEKDEMHRVAVGFTEAKYSKVGFHGEYYLIGGFGKFGINEDGISVLTVYLSFIETASDRVFKFYFHNNGNITLKIWEMPGKKYLYSSTEMFVENAAKNKVVEIFSTKTDVDYLRYKIEKILEPDLEGKIGG